MYVVWFVTFLGIRLLDKDMMLGVSVGCDKLTLLLLIHQ